MPWYLGLTQANVSTLGIPFVVYNYLQDASGSMLYGRGTSGNLFDAVEHAADFYTNDYTGTPTFSQAGQIYNTYDHFGGPLCSNPFTIVFGVDTTLGDAGVYGQWYLYGESWDGWLIWFELDTTLPYVFFEIFNAFIPMFAYRGALTAIDPLPTPITGNIMLTFDPLGGIGGAGAWINGVSQTLAGYSYHDGSCSQWQNGGSDGIRDHGAAEYPAPYAETTIDVFYPDGFKGLAMFRGTPTQTEFDYWAAYDWTTDPGL